MLEKSIVFIIPWKTKRTDLTGKIDPTHLTEKENARPDITFKLTNIHALELTNNAAKLQ